MAKKPPLTLVGSSATSPSPPRSLGKPGLSLWRAITSQYEIDDAGGIETLLQICEASDRLAEIATQIERDGLTIRTKTGVRDHPLLRTELGLRAFVTRNLVRLGVNVEAVQSVGRPAREHGLTWRDRQED